MFAVVVQLACDVEQVSTVLYLDLINLQCVWLVCNSNIIYMGLYTVKNSCMYLCLYMHTFICMYILFRCVNSYSNRFCSS